MAKIMREKGDRDAWICTCGNVPSGDGFYPCNADGREVEPAQGVWDGVLYVCNGCGRIIDQHTLDIVGHGTPPHKIVAAAK